MVSVATAFAVILGKEVFGGTGMNIWNHACTCLPVLCISCKCQEVWYGSQALLKCLALMPQQGATALGVAATGGAVGYSLLESFIGTIPGSIGENFNTCNTDRSADSDYHRCWQLEDYSFCCCRWFPYGTYLK